MVRIVYMVYGNRTVPYRYQYPYVCVRKDHFETTLYRDTVRYGNVRHRMSKSHSIFVVPYVTFGAVFLSSVPYRHRTVPYGTVGDAVSIYVAATPASK